MAERTRIQSQDRFGPAQSRAAIFSVFAPARVDRDAGRAALQAAEMAGAGAEYASQREFERAEQSAQREIEGIRQRGQRELLEARREVEEAEREREQGLRDYVSGLIQDGQRIVNGELQPIESRYYMAGVEMGRGRRRGRQVWQAFTEWQAENPRPGLGSDQDYNEWIESGLAFAQENAGIDPDNMSEAEYGEYSGVINQIRQRDNEQLIAQLNREAVQEQVESINSDISTMSLDHDPENLESTYTTATNLMARARANGMDLEAVRSSILTSFTNIARATGDVSVLENMPNGVLKSARIEAARVDAIRRVEAEIEAERLENQAEIVDRVHELVQSGDFDAADQVLNSAHEAGRITTPVRTAWDGRIQSQREAATAVEEQRIADRSNRASRNAAITQAIEFRTVGQGATWVNAETGEVEEITSRELVSLISQEALERHGGPTPEYFGELARLSVDQNVVVPALQSRLESVLQFASDEALMSGELSAGQTLAIQALMETTDEAVNTHVSEEEARVLRNARFIFSQTGGNRIEDVDARTRRLGEAVYQARELDDVLADAESAPRRAFMSNRYSGYSRRIVDQLDDATQNFELNFAIPSNLDGDNHALVDRWISRHTNIAEALEQRLGPEAAEEYIDNVVDSTLVVNRQPVSAIGSINARVDEYGQRPGQEFLQRLSNQVARDIIVPEIGMAYDSGFWNDVLGLTGEFDPLDPDAMSALAGNIDTQNVPGGLLFTFENSRVFIRENELNAMYERFLQDRESNRSEIAASNEQYALDRSAMPGLTARALQYMRESSDFYPAEYIPE